MQTLLELLWPSRCLSCGARADPQQALPLCALCAKSRHIHDGSRCRRCDDHSASGVCSRCRNKQTTSLTRARGVWRYEGATQRTILAGKNHGHEQVFAQLAQEVAADAEAQELGHNATALVPIPLRGMRRFQRGYNPSAIVARGLGLLWHRPVRHLLRRTSAHGRPPQSLLGAQARLQGMEHAFVAARGLSNLRGCTLVLVDDVITTGATLNAAAQVLRALGAERVWAVAVARQTVEHGVRATSPL